MQKFLVFACLLLLCGLCAAAEVTTIRVSCGPDLTPNPIVKNQVGTLVLSGVTMGPSVPRCDRMIIDWGDGSPVETVQGQFVAAYSTVFAPTHVYATAGVYTITATPMDTAGNTGPPKSSSRYSKVTVTN